MKKISTVAEELREGVRFVVIIYRFAVLTFIYGMHIDKTARICYGAK